MENPTVLWHSDLGNLALHCYHVTAIVSIHHAFLFCKGFFIFFWSFFVFFSVRNTRISGQGNHRPTRGVLHTRLCTFCEQKLQFRGHKRGMDIQERSVCKPLRVCCFVYGNLLPLRGHSRSVARVAAHKLLRLATQICSASADGRKGPTPGRRLPFY